MEWWALVPLALVCAAMATPYLLTHGALIGVVFERGFAIVCHQRPERSLWIFGGSVAVCSRCLGIYLGAAIGLLFRMSRTIALRLLMAAAAINLLDAASELAGLHGNWLGSAICAGICAGRKRRAADRVFRGSESKCAAPTGLRLISDVTQHSACGSMLG